MSDLVERREAVRNLMEYGVPEGLMDEAIDLLDIYRNDRIALELLHEFYGFLPDAKNDMVREIRLAGRKQGICLLIAVTPQNNYIYLVSSEGVEFQGAAGDGMYDDDVLGFFGYENREKFLDACRGPENFPVYESLDNDMDVCPACHAETGELHEFGCPVELCPWCGGQLVYCSCRYDRLELDVLSSEKDLARFEEILNEQGRIPYSPEQRPSFADDGDGLMVE